MIQVSPCKCDWVLFVNSLRPDVCRYVIAKLLFLHRIVLQACLVSSGNTNHLFFISEGSYLSRIESVDTLVNLSTNPVKFIHTVLLPRRIGSIKISLSALIEMNEWAWILEQVFLNLISKRRKLIHMLAATVVLLSL